MRSYAVLNYTLTNFTSVSDILPVRCYSRGDCNVLHLLLRLRSRYCSVGLQHAAHTVFWRFAPPRRGACNQATQNPGEASLQPGMLLQAPSSTESASYSREERNYTPLSRLGEVRRFIKRPWYSPLSRAARQARLAAESRTPLIIQSQSTGLLLLRTEARRLTLPGSRRTGRDRWIPSILRYRRHPPVPRHRI